MTAVLLFLSVLALEAVFVMLLLVVVFLLGTGLCMSIDWLMDLWYRAADRRARHRGDVAKVLELGDELLRPHR